jgi:hypothetical protein
MTSLRTTKMPERAIHERHETDRYCVVCDRDIADGTDAREIHIIGGNIILHPDDETLYHADGGDLGLHLIGPKCARKIGLKWSRMELTPNERHRCPGLDPGSVAL